MKLKLRDNANINRQHQLAIMEAALSVMQRDLSTLEEQLKRLRFGVDQGKVEREILVDAQKARLIESVGRAACAAAGLQINYPVEDALEVIKGRLDLLTTAYRRFMAEDRAIETLYAVEEENND